MQGKYLEDLKQKIKKKYDMIKADNTRNVENTWQAYLAQEYSSIEQTAKNGGYQSFENYISDISQFLNYVTENPPIEADGTKIVAEFMLAAMQDASALFIKGLENELRL